MQRWIVALSVVIAVVLWSPRATFADQKVVDSPQVLSRSGPTWNFTFRYPMVSVPGALMGVSGNMHDVSAACKQTALQALAAFQKDVADYGPPPPAFKNMKSVCDAKYYFMSKGAVISVKWEAYQMFAGGAHPVTMVITKTFLGGGEAVKIDDLFTNPTHGLALISVNARRQLEAQGKKMGFDLISLDGVSAKAENFAAFGITRSGLKIFFQYAQVGPGAAGDLTVTIPWSTLKSELKPEVWHDIQSN